MTPRTILTLLPVFVAPACVVENPLAPVSACIIPCWGFTQTIEDADSNGKFDDECFRHSLPGTTFAPDLPPSGKFHGTLCVESQAQDEAIRRVIHAVKTGTLQGVSQADIDTYLLLVYGNPPAGIAVDAWSRCFQWLESQDCETVDYPEREQAFALCDEFVSDPMRATLTDLTDCNWSPPTKDPPLYVHPQSNACVYIVTYDPISAESGSGDGGDEVCFYETSPGNSGGSSYGESTGEESEENEAPFGDLAALIDCSAGSSSEVYCAIDETLVHNVVQHFEVFYQEGIQLLLLDPPGLGMGVQITGLDDGEESEALLAAFEIQNDDAITHVNGIALDSEANVAQVVLTFETGAKATWTLTVRRQNGTSWSTRHYSIDIEHAQ